MPEQVNEVLEVAEQPATNPGWQSLQVARARPDSVDLENGIIHGMVVAQAGIFKDLRGEFDEDGLKEIVKLGNAKPRGLKSRMGHPTMSDDGIGRFLGRVNEFNLGWATDQDGKRVRAVRGNLTMDKSAYETPQGDIATYILKRTKSDPDSLSSSLVLEPEMIFRIDKKGKSETDKDGNELPPLWIPKRLHASDLVDTGAAVDSLLSPEEMAQALSIGLTPELEKLLRFDNVARLATQLLDGFFRGKDKDTVAAKCQGWLSRYLELRFPEEEPKPTPKLDAFKLRMREQQLTLDKLRGK